MTQLLLIAAQLGTHVFWLGSPAERLAFKAVTVEVPPLEFRNPRMDWEGLKNIARRSEGKYYDLYEFTDVVEYLEGAVKAREIPVDESRDDLWQILMMLVRRRSIDGHRKAGSLKRGGEPQSGEPAAIPVEELIADAEPTAEERVLFLEAFESRLAKLTDAKLRSIAIAKMCGFSNPEIAEQLGCSLRSVERKLSIIRGRWEDK